MPKIVFEAKKNIVSPGQAEELAGQLEERTPSGLNSVMDFAGHSRVFNSKDMSVIGVLPDVMRAPHDVELELQLGAQFVAGVARSLRERRLGLQSVTAGFNVRPAVITDPDMIRAELRGSFLEQMNAVGSHSLRAAGLDAEVFHSIIFMDW